MIDATDDEAFLEAVYDILQSKQYQKRKDVVFSLPKNNKKNSLRPPKKPVSQESKSIMRT